MPQVTDKHSEPIREGDPVYTRVRGGRHEGNVEQIVTTDKEAQEVGVKNPPKVRAHTLNRVDLVCTAADAGTHRSYSRTSTATRCPTIQARWSRSRTETSDVYE